MSHWYGFTIKYILHQMTTDQVILYYGNIPVDGRLAGKKVKDLDKPDYKAIEKLMGGKKVMSR